MLNPASQERSFPLHPSISDAPSRMHAGVKINVVQIRLNPQQREAHLPLPTGYVRVPLSSSSFLFFPPSFSFSSFSIFSRTFRDRVCFLEIACCPRVVCEGDGDCDDDGWYRPATGGETSTAGPLFGYGPISGR